MSRSKQVFEAPPSASDCSKADQPNDGSPWRRDRSAELFLEQWERILIFARTLDPAQAEKVAAWSFSSDPRDVVHVAVEELSSCVEFLGRVRAALASASALEPEPTDELPENFTNDEIARMIDAVVWVMKEAARLHAPFRAWRD